MSAPRFFENTMSDDLPDLKWFDSHKVHTKLRRSLDSIIKRTSVDDEYVVTSKVFFYLRCRDASVYTGTSYELGQ